jgi:hypothetical protein
LILSHIRSRTSRPESGLFMAVVIATMPELVVRGCCDGEDGRTTPTWRPSPRSTPPSPTTNSGNGRIEQLLIYYRTKSWGVNVTITNFGKNGETKFFISFVTIIFYKVIFLGQIRQHCTYGKNVLKIIALTPL